MKRFSLILLLLVVMVGSVLAQESEETLVPAGTPGETVYVAFPVSIVLDGDLSDWAGIPTYTVDKGPMLSGDPAENGSFTFAVASDRENFYITMTMPDQNIIAGQHGTNFWNEDSFDFYLNLTGNFAAKSFTEGIFQVNINGADLGNTDPSAITVTGIRSGDAGAQAIVFRTDDGWGFEGSVPLADRFEVTHGAEAGFQAQANGAANVDRNVKLIWSNADTGDSSWQNPSVFGRALFYEIGRTDVPQPSVVVEAAPVDWQSMDWPAIVSATWDGYKANYIYCGANCGNNLGLVFDPNMGYQAVSEGVGYGLLMAVMMDDQETFNTIYDAAYTYMLDESTGLLNWRIDNTGQITGFSSATDAEEDIAAALIFAEKRVERGEWEQHATRPYDEQANTVIDAIYQYEVYDGKYLTPGDDWDGNGQDIINLSYFAPAWYRLYDEFQGTDRWMPVIRQGYQSLFQVRQGNQLGLAPDWSTYNGRPAYEYCDAEGRPREGCRYEMTYDAIRVPWRIGLDCLWYGDSRACEWSRRSAEFLKSLDGDDVAKMYDMQGQPVVDYQNELMAGMWLVAALAADDPELQGEIGGMLYDYSSNALAEGYFGGTSQYYFNQSLAWFGASLVSGDFRNLYDEE